MVYCAAFGCNNRETKGNGLSFFSVPKGRPAEKSLDPLLSTMEFRSNIRSQIVLHPLRPWLLWKGSFENDGTWCWWNLQPTTEARCNPKCAPSITWILDISGPGHLGTDLDISVLGPGHFGTDLDISVLGTGQFGTWMRQYTVLTTIVWYLLIVNIFVLVVL